MLKRVAGRRHSVCVLSSVKPVVGLKAAFILVYVGRGNDNGPQVAFLHHSLRSGLGIGRFRILDYEMVPNQ